MRACTHAPAAAAAARAFVPMRAMREQTSAERDCHSQACRVFASVPACTVHGGGRKHPLHSPCHCPGNHPPQPPPLRRAPSMVAGATPSSPSCFTTSSRGSFSICSVAGPQHAQRRRAQRHTVRTGRAACVGEPSANAALLGSALQAGALLRRAKWGDRRLRQPSGLSVRV